MKKLHPNIIQMSKKTDDDIIADMTKKITDLDKNTTDKLSQINSTYADTIALYTNELNTRNAKLEKLATDLAAKVATITSSLDTSITLANTAKTNADTVIKNA
jgi:hypothetical protein